MKKKLENRREFLKKVCPTIAFAFFGLSFLEACSTGDDSDNDNSGGNDQNGGSDNNDNNNDPLGFSSSGGKSSPSLNKFTPIKHQVNDKLFYFSLVPLFCFPPHLYPQISLLHLSKLMHKHMYH